MGLGKIFRRRKTKQKKAARELARKLAQSTDVAGSTPHTIDTVEIISIEGPSMTCLEAIATNLTPRFDEHQHFNNTSHHRHVDTIPANSRASTHASQNVSDDSSDSSEDENSESSSSSSSSSQSHSSQSHSDESNDTSKVYISGEADQEEDDDEDHDDEDHDDSSCSSNSSQFTQESVSVIHRNVIVANDDLETVFTALQSIEDIDELDESSLGEEGDMALNPIENGSTSNNANANSKARSKSVLSRSYKSLDDTISRSSETQDTRSAYSNRPAVQCYPNDKSLGYLFDFVTCTKTDRRGCIAGVLDDDNFTIATHSDNESILTGRLGGQQRVSMLGRSESPSLAGLLEPKEDVGLAMKLVSVSTEKTVHATNCTSASLSKVEEEDDNGDWNDETDEDSFVFFDAVCAPTKCEGLTGDRYSVNEDDCISPSTNIEKN